MSAGLKRPAKREEAPAAPAPGLWENFMNRWTAASDRGKVFYDRAAPYVSWASDMTWAVGSTAVILSLPILVEIQRETTVLITQKQREMEQQQLAEQQRLQSGGFLAQMAALAGSGAPST